MGQISIGIGKYVIPPQGCCSFAFDWRGKPIYLDQLGIAHELYSDVTVDGVTANVLANLGVGAEADLPTASAGFTYVTSDTFKIYQGVGTGIYDVSDLSLGQFVTDIYSVEPKNYQFIGTELILVSGGCSSVEICEQSDVEQAEPTENTKATSALRAWQGFVYWIKNTTFSDLTTTAKTVQGGINELAARKEVIYASQAEAIEAVETEKTMNPLRVGQHWSYAIANNSISALNTTSKKIVGSINELKIAWDNVLIALDLKAMQNVGVCQKIPIYPEDLIIDPVALTFTIATVNRGQAITANNPIRVFTDGSGSIKKWEKPVPQTVTFTKTLGAWGVYFDNTGTLKCDQTVWADFATIAPIARFYVNDQLANAEMIEPNVWEAHLNDVSATARKVMHFTNGAENISGFDIVSNVLTPDANGKPTVAPNADGRNTVISLTGGENSDDGLFYTVVNSTNNLPFNQDLGHLTSSTLTALNSGLFRVRKNDSAGRLAFNPATRFPFAWNSSNNRPQYVTELGVFTDVPDNRWIVNFIYSFQDWVAGRAVKVVSAHAAFATYNEALAYGWESIRNLYPTMRDQELRQLYKLIHYVDHSGGEAYPAGCKYAGLVSITDIRKSVQSAVTATGGATLASNVLLTPPTGYTSNNVQLGVEELAANTIKGNTTVHTTPIAADSIGILDSVAGLFKRIPLSSIKTFVLNGLTTTQVSNTSTNVTGNTVTDVFDNMVRYTQSDTVPQNPRNKDLWLDTSNTRQPVLYQYFIDANADGFWVCFDISGKNEIPNIASGEKVVTKSATGVNVNKDMIDMQIAAGTIASANWSTGKATYPGQQGQVTYDNNYKYECIGTNLWIRTSVVQAVMDLYLADIDDSGGAKTSAELNTAYSTAQIGQRVWGSQFMYEKKNGTDWKKITAVTA